MPSGSPTAASASRPSWRTSAERGREALAAVGLPEGIRAEMLTPEQHLAVAERLT